jgi:ABC-2 type transport system permease protein
MFWAVQQTLVFPLMLLSGMLLPVEEGPGWLRALSALDPLTYVVQAERALFAGDVLTADVLQGVVAAAGVAAAGLLLGVRAIRRAAP